jgi:hypothetical protein
MISSPGKPRRSGRPPHAAVARRWLAECFDPRRCNRLAAEAEGDLLLFVHQHVRLLPGTSAAVTQQAAIAVGILGGR